MLLTLHRRQHILRVVGVHTFLRHQVKEGVLILHLKVYRRHTGTESLDGAYLSACQYGSGGQRATKEASQGSSSSAYPYSRWHQTYARRELLAHRAGKQRSHPLERVVGDVRPLLSRRASVEVPRHSSRGGSAALLPITNYLLAQTCQLILIVEVVARRVDTEGIRRKEPPRLTVVPPLTGQLRHRLPVLYKVAVDHLISLRVEVRLRHRHTLHTLRLGIVEHTVRSVHLVGLRLLLRRLKLSAGDVLRRYTQHHHRVLADQLHLVLYARHHLVRLPRFLVALLAGIHAPVVERLTHPVVIEQHRSQLRLPLPKLVQGLVAVEELSHLTSRSASKLAGKR